MRFSMCVLHPSYPFRGWVSAGHDDPVISSSCVFVCARAYALRFEQDDCPDNFVGAGPKGKHPNIICARLQTPLTVAQLTQALELFHRQEASLQSDPSTPSPFFFFDFDGTLTLADGLLQVESGSGSLDQLFGNAERRRTLQLTLSTLLQAGRCYVLTANGVVWRTSRRPCRIHGAHTPCRWSFVDRGC
jgi:hypothetical protein